ncbi:MAG: RhuM family protein [bacterium]
MFWRKVLDIYATSVDYDLSAEASRRFFQTVQNKMQLGIARPHRCRSHRRSWMPAP